MHHGSYIRSLIAGRDELAGSDVILVHRLLKGAVAADARANGFALFTGAAIERLGLDPIALGLKLGGESIEHIGRISTFTLNLEARWQAETIERRLDPSGEVILDLDATLGAEPSVVWANLTSPALRGRWEGPITIEEASPGGRRGVGTVSQCVTGRLATLEEIVDWQPFEHVGWRIVVPDLGPVGATADLEAVDGGTQLHVRWRAQAGAQPNPEVVRGIRNERESAFARLVSAIGGPAAVS